MAQVHYELQNFFRLQHFPWEYFSPVPASHPGSPLARVSSVMAPWSHTTLMLWWRRRRCCAERALVWDLLAWLPRAADAYFWKEFQGMFAVNPSRGSWCHPWLLGSGATCQDTSPQSCSLALCSSNKHLGGRRNGLWIHASILFHLNLLSLIVAFITDLACSSY